MDEADASPAQPDTLGVDASQGAVEVDGARLAYVEVGPADGEPVVLVHGYGSDHRSWRHQLPALAERHRVLALDWFGWGRSERPLGLRFEYDAEVARLGRALDAVGAERCNLAGHDYGGFLSLGLVQREPERVMRLALLNTRAHRTFVLRWYATFGGLSLMGRIPLVRELAARLPHAAIHRRFMASELERGSFDDDLLDGYVGWMEGHEGRRWLLRFSADYRVAARRELVAGLTGVSCPTAVIWGARDAYLARRIPLELAERIPGAKLTLLEGAGHFVMEERPEEVTKALRELLER